MRSVLTLGAKLLNLLHIYKFEISVSQWTTQYSPARNDVINTVVHENVRLSHVIVSDIPESDHLPIISHLLDHVRTRNLLEPDKFTDWEQFQNLASELISPRI
jgi:hypothetical protein